ncbi:Carotenoid oxygenase [Corchorus capsularis]|uniref:Carotenoid oxygenase n=1 Tax=Corchorus capsularis TaxID=210143 RepID=A0A1R3G175_COCAP|nr:Carotenoid oxygenase [Corchorus capsularis]
MDGGNGFLKLGMINSVAAVSLERLIQFQSRQSRQRVVYEMRLTMKTGVATQKKLSESAVDFPRVNENYTGRHFVNLQKLYQAKCEADFLAIEQVLGIFKLAEI